MGCRRQTRLLLLICTAILVQPQVQRSLGLPPPPPPPPPRATPACRKPGAEYPPFTAYWKPAITNCVGPACGLAALKYISYPAQVSSPCITTEHPALPCCGRPYAVARGIHACSRADGQRRGQATCSQQMIAAVHPCWGASALRALAPQPAAGAGQVVKDDTCHAHGNCAARQALLGARVRLLPGHLRYSGLRGDNARFGLPASCRPAGTVSGIARLLRSARRQGMPCLTPHAPAALWPLMAPRPRFPIGLPQPAWACLA